MSVVICDADAKVGIKHQSIDTIFIFQDHSQAGQKSIDYRQTVYGNEVYRGCFNDPDIHYRTLAYSLPITNTNRNSMTPDYCMKICR